MQTALRLDATVLPGHRLDVTSPDLPEGARVELIVMLPESDTAYRAAHGRRYVPMLELTQAQPMGPRSAATWEALDRSLQAERDAWDQ